MDLRESRWQRLSWSAQNYLGQSGSRLLSKCGSKFNISPIRQIVYTPGYGCPYRWWSPRTQPGRPAQTPVDEFWTQWIYLHSLDKPPGGLNIKYNCYPISWQNIPMCLLKLSVMFLFRGGISVTYWNWERRCPSWAKKPLATWWIFFLETLKWKIQFKF